MKKIKVIYRKLGKQQAHGICEDTHIELDSRLKGKKALEILTHEAIHYLFPELTEEETIKISIILTNTLWHEGYRRIDNDVSVPLQDGSI